MLTSNVTSPQRHPVPVFHPTVSGSGFHNAPSSGGVAPNSRPTSPGDSGPVSGRDGDRGPFSWRFVGRLSQRHGHDSEVLHPPTSEHQLAVRTDCFLRGCWNFFFLFPFIRFLRLRSWDFELVSLGFVCSVRDFGSTTFEEFEALGLDS